MGDKKSSFTSREEETHWILIRLDQGKVSCHQKKAEKKQRKHLWDRISRAIMLWFSK